MIEHPNVIPVAVVVAICIFLAKEGLELVRRVRLNGRKLHAIKRFLAVECERNSFAIEKIIGQVRAVDEAHEKGWPVEVEKKESGLTRLTVRPAGKGYSSSVIRPIHMDAAQKYLFEIASLDGSMFEMMEGALDALGEAKHVRDSLIEYITTEPVHLGGFKDYAIGELDDALEAIRALYFKCTNEPLAKGRVR